MSSNFCRNQATKNLKTVLESSHKNRGSTILDVTSNSFNFMAKIAF